MEFNEIATLRRDFIKSYRNIPDVLTLTSKDFDSLSLYVVNACYDNCLMGMEIQIGNKSGCSFNPTIEMIDNYIGGAKEA